MFLKYADVFILQPGEIEDALCKQYSIREVRLLGHGNISRLLIQADKSSRHVYGDATVVYETPLNPSTG